MSAFATHGIDHLSPSSLNAYLTSPALWVLERLLGKRSPMGAAAHRGTAAEMGVQQMLLGATLGAAQDIAADHYRRLTALSGDPNRAKEGEAVHGCVYEGYKAIKSLGTPVGYQTRVEWYDPVYLSVPIVGILDWEFPEVIVDLKTQLRLTSAITAAHARQVALYSRTTNKPVKVLYATPTKAALYDLEDPQGHFMALVKIGQTLERFLALSSDPKELAALLLPDTDHYYFNNQTTRAHVREVWGM